MYQSIRILQLVVQFTEPPKAIFMKKRTFTISDKSPKKSSTSLLNQSQGFYLYAHLDTRVLPLILPSHLGYTSLLTQSLEYYLFSHLVISNQTALPTQSLSKCLSSHHVTSHQRVPNLVTNSIQFTKNNNQRESNENFYVFLL